MIPLSIPELKGKEWEYVKECIDTGWISSAGSYVDAFEKAIADYTGAKYAVACMNGTVGLHIAQILLGINENHHVIAPNITFVATLNAISYTGARPILMDVDIDSWQLDMELLEKFLQEECSMDQKQLIYKKTGKVIKAVMPVHVLGNVGDMAKLKELANEFNFHIIEDSTESLGTKYRNQSTGVLGDLGVFSFNGNKIISTGGGGVIVTNNESLAKRAKHITTTAKVNNLDYIHDEVGYNYRMVNVLAAIGVAQMEQLPDIVKKKKFIDSYYRDNLKDLSEVKFQMVSTDVDPNCWLFTMSVKDMRGLLSFLNDNGVQSRPFWMPMNKLEMYTELEYYTVNNHSKNIYESCISIPSSAGITNTQLEEVVNKIKEFYNK